MDMTRDLELLIATRHPIVAIETQEEARVTELLQHQAVRQNLPLFDWKITRGLQRLGTRDPIYDTSKPQQALRWAAAMKTEALYLFHDLNKFFGEPLILRELRDIGQQFTRDRRTLVLCATEMTIPADLRSCTATIVMALPGTRELRKLAVRTLRDLGAPRKIKIDLTLPELERLIDNLRGLTLLEAQRVLMRAALDDLRIDRADFKLIIERKKALLSRDGVLELFPQETRLKEIGGLQNLKRWLRTRGAAFAPGSRRHGLEPPRGALLLGVQGCGKSLCAKAVASEWSLPLLRFDAGSLYDKFVGESEKNLRQALSTAEAMSPCVLWIDEIEKGFARDGGGADGGLSRRILGTFLGWMQERKRPVFVVATANDIQALPPEMLRKGRFDEIFFVDLPRDPDRRSILAVHLARRRQDPSRFDLARLSTASRGFSGAELESAVVSSLYRAYSDRRPLASEHLLETIQAAVPLSRTCAEKIEELREWARGRAVPAGRTDLEADEDAA